MRRSKELALWCAIELCSILGTSNEKSLVQDVVRFVSDRRLLDVTPDEIAHQVKWATGATLYAKYRNELTEVKSVHHIKALQRKLWFYYVISLHYRSIDYIELQKCIAKKFTEEQSIDNGLTDKEFVLFEIMDRRIRDEETIVESGFILEKIRDLFSDAFAAMKKTCDDLGCDYLSVLYGEDEAKQAKVNRSAPQQSIYNSGQGGKAVIPNGSTQECSSIAEAIDVEEVKALAQKTERTLKDTISVLEKDKHNLEIKLNYAKNDIVRNLLLSLTDYDYGAPLSELYLLMKDNGTPERIKGIINNLFLAFGNESIKTVKEKYIGEVMVLDESNQIAFDPIKNETIFLGDKVEICYPGYRFGGETMIRPTVRKVKETK